MNLELLALLDLILNVFRKYINKIVVNEDEALYIYIDHNNLYTVVSLLKDSFLFSFNVLVDMTAVDWLNREMRFELYYNLFSYLYNNRIVLVFGMYVDNMSFVYGYGIRSLSSIYKSAVWLEREVWDMFGLFFYDHPDLRRILTDYGFSGFPLRKDFPLTGYKEIRYDDTLKLIVSDTVKLSQEFRSFVYNNPWI